MLRRAVTTAVLVACAGVYAFAAERGTFILTDGERKSGPIVFHGDAHENLIGGYYNLGVDGGKDMSFGADQVAVIDFVGGTPPTTELAKLGTSQMLVLRNGYAQEGRLINLIGGDTVLWENLAKQQQSYGIRDVSRVYLNPQSARTAFNYTPPAAPAPAAATAQPQAPNGRTRNQGTQPATGGRDSGNQNNRADQGSLGNQRDQVDQQADQRDRRGSAQGVTVRMDTRQGWIDSGVTVNRGDRLVFEISAGMRGVVGRIDNGASFAIDAAQPIVMRGAGRLMLGVTDDVRRRDGGAFTVRVSHVDETGRSITR